MAIRSLAEQWRFNPVWFARSGRSTESLFRTAACLLGAAGLALLSGLAVLLTARRLGGALAAPLPAATMAATACLLALAAFAIRGALLFGFSRVDRPGVVRAAWPGDLTAPAGIPWSLWLAVVSPTIAVALFASAVTLPRSSSAAYFLLLAPLLAEEGLALRWLGRQRPRSLSSGDREEAREHSHGEDPAREAEDRAQACDEETEELVDDEPGSADALSANAVQQLTRGRAADGRDECHGWLRAEFAAGQRTEIAHLAFCPPFPSAPQWSAELVEGPPLKIKNVQVLAYGVRFELRLDEVARGPVSSLIRFAALERR